MESRAYYENMIYQLTGQLDSVTDEIHRLASNQKDISQTLADMRSEYIYNYPLPEPDED